jgi:hypothetical protein
MPDRNPIKYEGGEHRPFAPGDTLPPSVLALLQRVRAGNGIEIVNNGDGTLTIVNTCCDTQPPNGSVHTLTISPVLASINEGEDACWAVVLNAPVAGLPLTVAFTLAGDEQAIHGYPAPSATFALGETRATVCVPTIDDATDEPNRQLTLQPVFGSRLTGWTPPGNQIDTLLVIDNDGVGAHVYTIVSITPPASTIIEGQAACWDIVLDRAVDDSPLTVSLAFSGDEQAQHGYPVPPLVIPVGASGGPVCVVTNDDIAIEPDRALTLRAMPDARIIAVPPPSTITVRDNDGVPIFGAGLGSLGDLCCVTPGGSGASTSFTLQFRPDGAVVQSTSCGIDEVYPGAWAQGPFIAADYEIEVRTASDEGDIGGIGAWLNLGVARTFTYVYTLAGGVSGGRFVMTRLNIRRASDQQIMVGPVQVGVVQLGVNTECV